MFNSIIANVMFSFIITILILWIWFVLNKTFNKILNKFESYALANRLLITLKVFSFVWLLIVWIFLILLSFWVEIKTLITGVWVSWLIFTLVWKDYLTNFFSSVTFLLNWVFKIGDKIKVGSIQGEIEEITINYIKLKDDNGNLIFFPNKKLSSEPIEHLKK